MKNQVYLAVLVALAFLTGCGGDDKAPAQENSSASVKDTTKVLGTNNRILGVARIEPADGLINLTAGTTGKILFINVVDNQQVKKGEQLIEVEMAVENAQLTQAESKIRTQQATIEASRATLAALTVNLKNAQETYARNLQLFEGKALTKENLDNSRASQDKLAKDVESAEANSKQASARINELQADINYYQTVVAQKKVTASLPGKILNVLVKTGEYVTNATQIAEFAPEGYLIAKTEVDELYAEKIKIGQKAMILSQTTGEKMAEGTVTYAADYLKTKSLFKDQATEQEDRRVREVHIKLASGTMPLIGSRVDCMIYLD